MFRSILFSFFFLLIFFVPTFAAEFETPKEEATCDLADESTIYLFGREACAHCKDAKDFLGNLENSGKIHFHYLPIEDELYKDTFYKLLEKESLPKVLPLTYIGGRLIQGFDKAETTGQEILKFYSLKNKIGIEEFLKKEKETSDFVLEPTSGTCSVETSSSTCSVEDSSKLISVPFFGQVELKDFSLGASSVLLGFIDGFNPCAMWVLVMFLTALMQIGDRKKMFQIAGIFILAEAVMYFLILNVWMNTWDFIGLDKIITPIVGVVAVGAGFYFLYDWHKGDGTCKVGSLEQKRKTHQKIKEIASKPMTIAVFFTILGLAFSVNVIEFACSVGIPQTFTKILDLNPIPFIEKQFWMSIYILFYMIDDLIVFAIAIYSIDKLGLTSKYSQYSHLIGGILMLLLGLILLIKPELLVF